MTEDLESELAEPARGLRAFRSGLGSYGLLPLVVLAGLAAAQSFDSNAFGVLAPEIRHTFHLDNAGIDSVAGLTGALPLLLSVFIGHWGDRSDRIRISRYSALLWGVTAILTGLAPVLALLVIARLLGGVGLLSTQTVYPSLLSDYYPLNRRAQVFTIFLLFSTGLGLVATPLAGLLGDTYGWRPTFVLLAIPTFVFAFLLSKLRDPSGRGNTSPVVVAEQMVAETAASIERKSIRESFRIIKQSRTLRRTWLGAFILGGAAAPIATLLSTFFHDVYHVNSTGRGAIIAAVGVGGLIGLVISGALAQRILANGRSRRLPVIAGLMAAACAICVFLIACSPSLWFAVVVTALAGIGLGGFLPAYTTIVSIVSPAEFRSQAFAWSTVFFAIGAVVVSVFVGTLADAAGQRTAVGALALVVIVGGLVLTSARRFIDAEVIESSPTGPGITDLIG
jgi:MFS family permease